MDNCYIRRKFLVNYVSYDKQDYLQTYHMSQEHLVFEAILSVLSSLKLFTLATSFILHFIKYYLIPLPAL